MALIGSIPCLISNNYKHITWGLSGSAVFNRRTRKVIGIIHGFNPDINVGFIIPIKNVFQKWDNLASTVEEENWLTRLKDLKEKKTEISDIEYLQVLESSKIISTNKIREYKTLGNSKEKIDVFFSQIDGFLKYEFFLWDAEQKKNSYISLPNSEISKINIQNTHLFKIHQIKCSLKHRLPLTLKNIGSINLSFLYIPPGTYDNIKNPKYGFYILEGYITDVIWRQVTDQTEVGETSNHKKKVNISPKMCEMFFKEMNAADDIFKDLHLRIPTENEVSFAFLYCSEIDNTKTEFEEICISSSKKASSYLAKSETTSRKISPLTKSDDLGFRIAFSLNPLKIELIKKFQDEKTKL